MTAEVRLENHFLEEIRHFCARHQRHRRQEMTVDDVPVGKNGFRLKRDTMHLCQKVAPTKVIFVSYVGPDRLRDTLSRVGSTEKVRTDEEIEMVAAA